MFCLCTSLQYKGRPLVEYRGPSTVAAVCVAGAGYMMLFLIGIAAGVMALCRPGCPGKFCSAITFRSYVLTTWCAHILSIDPPLHSCHHWPDWTLGCQIYKGKLYRLSVVSTDMSPQSPFSLPRSYWNSWTLYIVVLTNFCWVNCFTFISPHNNLNNISI